MLKMKIHVSCRRRMSGAEERRGSGEDSGEGERAKSSKNKKEKSKETEKQEKSKEREKSKETEKCKAAEEKVTTDQEGQADGNANNTPDSPKKDASTDPLEDAGICVATQLLEVHPADPTVPKDKWMLMN